MNLIVLSSSQNIPNEKETVIALFEKGLESFQVHKPSLSEGEIRQYIDSFPEKYSGKVSLHTRFPKFHSLNEMQNYRETYEYAFLSPIFDSISKQGYKSNYDFKELKEKLPLFKNKIIALGGIDEDKIEVARTLGFAGVAVLGAIWESNSPVEKFVRLKTVCQK